MSDTSVILQQPVQIVSVDIETLGLSPRSAILEVGIARALFGLDELRMSSFTLPFCAKDNVWRAEEASTCAWWAEQERQGNTTYVEYLRRKRTKPLPPMAEEVARILRAMAGENYTTLYYCNHTSFDFAILRDAVAELNDCRTEGMQIELWNYKAERDLATMYAQYGHIVPRPPRASMPHRAITDAEIQLRWLHELYKAGVELL